MFLGYLLTQEEENPTRVKGVALRLITFKFHDLIAEAHTDVMTLNSLKSLLGKATYKS